jgi:hypothetical protein
MMVAEIEADLLNNAVSEKEAMV